jgi:hypothetical protein
VNQLYILLHLIIIPNLLFKHPWEMIHEAEKPNSGQIIEHKWDLYKPAIRPNTANQNQAKPMPSKVENINQFKK